MFSYIKPLNSGLSCIMYIPKVRLERKQIALLSVLLVIVNFFAVRNINTDIKTVFIEL